MLYKPVLDWVTSRDVELGLREMIITDAVYKVAKHKNAILYNLYRSKALHFKISCKVITNS